MRYHNITHDDITNGAGIRVVLWLSGCEHHCKGCHNPITWDPFDGLKFNLEAKEEIEEELKKDYVSGLTITGGDPFHPCNREEVYLLCKELNSKFPDKTIWIYTGYEWEDLLHFLPEDFSKYIKVIIDGKFVKKKKT